jgi:hypothetical protein
MEGTLQISYMAEAEAGGVPFSVERGRVTALCGEFRHVR